MRTFAPHPQRAPQPSHGEPARPPAPPGLQAQRGGPAGAPLDAETRARFEPRFGHDFSRVRVHAGGEASRAARAARARAYTAGHDIVFAEGAYRPHEPQGQRLLAHELAHVVQQRRGGSPGRALGARGDADEEQAERAATALGWGGLHARYGSVSAEVVRHGGSRPAAGVPTLGPALSWVQRVELTYDDGPDSAGNTRAVLDALNAAGARATFYLVGKRVAQGSNWRVVFDIAAGGHWLGNHAYDWDDTNDNHIFLHGTAEERAEKILNTEWAIRDALIQGRDDAKKNKTWDGIPKSSRDYIDDVIAHGTGRFRTPGFRSKWWSRDGTTTLAAIASVNDVLAATGLRPLRITEVGTLDVEGVTVDPEDWRKGRTQADIESSVKGDLDENSDSILLHSRLAASAAATPAIVSDIKSRNYTFDPTVQGALGSVGPKAGFAGLSTISNPPTAAEMSTARAFFRKWYLKVGPMVAGEMAVKVFQMAQRVGQAEVSSFAAEIKGTTVDTDTGPVPLANWMMKSETWRLFAGFFENWATNKPFPKIKGVTI